MTSVFQNDRDDLCHDDTNRIVESGSGRLNSDTRGSMIRSKIPTWRTSAKKTSSGSSSATTRSIPLPGEVFSPSSPQRRFSDASKSLSPRKSGSALVGAPIVTSPGSPSRDDRKSLVGQSLEKRASTSSIPLPGSVFGGTSSTKGTGTSNGTNFNPNKDVGRDENPGIFTKATDDELNRTGNGDSDNSNPTKIAKSRVLLDSESPVTFNNTDILKESGNTQQPHMFASMITKSLLSFRGRNVEFYSEEMASMYESIAGEYHRGNNDEESRRASLLAYTTSTRIRRYLNRHENQPPISVEMIALIRTKGNPHEGNTEFKREEKLLQKEIDQMSRFLYGILKQDDEILLVDDNEAVEDYHEKINQSVALEIYGRAKFKEGNYEEAKGAYRLAIRMEHAYFGSSTPSLARLKGNLSRLPGAENDEKEGNLFNFVASEGNDEEVKGNLSKSPFDMNHENDINHDHTEEAESKHPENVEKRPSDTLVQEAEEKEPLPSLNSSISRIQDDEEENQIDRFDAEEDDSFHAESRDVSFLSDYPPSLHSMSSSSTPSSSTAPHWLSAVPTRCHPLIWITVGFLLAHVPTLMESFSVAHHGIEWKLKEVFIADPAMKVQGPTAPTLKPRKKESRTS